MYNICRSLGLLDELPPQVTRSQTAKLPFGFRMGIAALRFFAGFVSVTMAGGYLINILTGYISLQTEHHLFPMMPTAHLSKCQPDVRAFFKKHKLHYRESNLIECVKFNIAALRHGNLHMD